MEYISSPAHISQYLRRPQQTLTGCCLSAQQMLTPCLLKEAIIALCMQVLVQSARESPAACSHILCKGVHRRSRLLRQAAHTLVYELRLRC